jgi:hypothetical protein
MSIPPSSAISGDDVMLFETKPATLAGLLDAESDIQISFNCAVAARSLPPLIAPPPAPQEAAQDAEAALSVLQEPPQAAPQAPQEAAPPAPQEAAQEAKAVQPAPQEAAQEAKAAPPAPQEAAQEAKAAPPAPQEAAQEAKAAPPAPQEAAPVPDPDSSDEEAEEAPRSQNQHAYLHVRVGVARTANPRFKVGDVVTVPRAYAFGIKSWDSVPSIQFIPAMVIEVAGSGRELRVMFFYSRFDILRDVKKSDDRRTSLAVWFPATQAARDARVRSVVSNQAKDVPFYGNVVRNRKKRYDQFYCTEQADELVDDESYPYLRRVARLTNSNLQLIWPHLTQKDIDGLDSSDDSEVDIDSSSDEGPMVISSSDDESESDSDSDEDYVVRRKTSDRRSGARRKGGKRPGAAKRVRTESHPATKSRSGSSSAGNTPARPRIRSQSAIAITEAAKTVHFMNIAGVLRVCFDTAWDLATATDAASSEAGGSVSSTTHRSGLCAFFSRLTGSILSVVSDPTLALSRALEAVREMVTMRAIGASKVHGGAFNAHRMIAVHAPLVYSRERVHFLVGALTSVLDSDDNNGEGDADDAAPEYAEIAMCTASKFDEESARDVVAEMVEHLRNHRRVLLTFVNALLVQCKATHKLVHNTAQVQTASIGCAISTARTIDCASAWAAAVTREVDSFERIVAASRHIVSLIMEKAD